jgi:hypothetical protein
LLFVICVRLNKKEASLNGFKVHLRNARDQEIRTALAEILKSAAQVGRALTGRVVRTILRERWLQMAELFHRLLAA